MRRWALLMALSFAVTTLAAKTAVATFSMVAVDPVTQEVGSVGASCIAGSIIISDVHPGLGVIHTQAWWRAQNQNYARSLMNQGMPWDLISWNFTRRDGRSYSAKSVTQLQREVSITIACGGGIDVYFPQNFHRPR